MNAGTIKIKKPSTLQRWIDKGWYSDAIKEGYVFSPGCGRFTESQCGCTKCRRSGSGSELKKVLRQNRL